MGTLFFDVRDDGGYMRETCSSFYVKREWFFTVMKIDTMAMKETTVARQQSRASMPARPAWRRPTGGI